MRPRALRRLGAVLLVAAAVVAWGKKGDPLPPLRTVPARVVDLTAVRSGDRIQLHFTVPPGNEDGTVLPPERIEIYRLAAAAAAQPSAAEIMQEERNLRAQLPVRSPDEPATPVEEGQSPPPAPGDRASFTEEVAPGATADAWVYVAVGVVGRNRRGPASAAVSVPLTVLPEPPVTVSATHDERSIQLAWEGGGPQFHVVGVGAAFTPSTGQRLTPKPLPAAHFELPVEFGRERCFVVRSVQVTGAVTTEGPPSSEQCLTPVDRYPPAAPTDLQAIQEGNFITLNWTPVEATDLAGYIVLRGDADGVNMQPVVREPIRETTFRDQTVQSGATYTYSVYAVDNAPAANVSQQSERQVVAVR